MPTLTEDVKRFIVQRLAMYDTPSEVAAAVKDEFAIEVPRQQVHQYNPLGSPNNAVAKKWVDLFKATRKTFLKDTSTIPVAQRAYRLRKLDEMARDALKSKNRQQAAALMEQAAKECGDAFTNKRELTGKGGKPLFESLTDDQLDRRLQALQERGGGSD
jgi:hypothetical protein